MPKLCRELLVMVIITHTKFGLNTVKLCRDTTLHPFSLFVKFVCVLFDNGLTNQQNLLLAWFEDDVVIFLVKLDKWSRRTPKKWGFLKIQMAENYAIACN